MNKKPKEIKLAHQYLNKNEYSKVIALLQPKIPLFIENKEFYILLAKSFFYTGDLSGAKLYFDRGQKIIWDIDSALYLAVIGLKTRDFNSAIRIWLDVLDETPNHKIAKLGLSTLQKYTSLEDLDYYVHSKKVEKLIPRRPIYIPLGLIISMGIFIILGAGGVIVIKNNLISLDYLLNENNSLYEKREGNSYFELDSLNKNYIDFKKVSEYTLTGSQIEDMFNIAHDLFIRNQDNRVRTYINQIKYSNANEMVKGKALKLENYLVDPDWASYSDDITFSDVANNLLKYENCMVKWKGSISNLEINSVITFDLLVGYEERLVLEGVVEVVLNQNLSIDTTKPLEVFGKIILRNNSFYIEAYTVSHYIKK